MGLRFPAHIGVAAGFDSAGVLGRRLGRLGFGFVDVGTVTARQEAGRGAPMATVRMNLAHAAATASAHDNETILGLTVGPTLDADPETATNQILTCLGGLADFGDLYTVTLCGRGGRLHWPPDQAAQILNDVGLWARRVGIGPMAVKLPAHPSLLPLAAEARRAGFAAVVAENVDDERLALLANTTAVIAVGGIRRPQDVTDRRTAGASLVASCRALMVGGPTVARHLCGASFP